MDPADAIIRNFKEPTAPNTTPNFRFKVKWEENGKPIYVAGFSRVSGMTQSAKVIRHREGGDPSTMHLSPGQSEYGPITFERGVSYDSRFEQWANKVFDYKNTQTKADDAKSLSDYRKTLTIEVYNEAGQKVLAYTVYNAWVSEFQAMTDLDANGEAAILIQSMTVQNEGWERDGSVTEPVEPSFTMPKS